MLRLGWWPRHSRLHTRLRSHHRRCPPGPRWGSRDNCRNLRTHRLLRYRCPDRSWGWVTESKPGDADYNGGRWHANALKEGVPADKYANACTVENLDLNDFDSTDAYFECPLLPSTRAGGPGGDEVVVAAIAASLAPVDFLRGDANADGIMDMSDGVSVLSWLFLGDREPSCLDCTDTNDSGTIDASDAITIFGFLFLGENAPPPPSATAHGPDPTEDELHCTVIGPCPHQSRPTRVLLAAALVSVLAATFVRVVPHNEQLHGLWNS